MNRVAIICPCYNEANYLDSFLNSLSKQTIFFNDKYHVSVFIADGKSTDTSRSLLEKYCQDRENWNVLDNEERFVSPGLNKCIRTAKHQGAQFIVRMDMHAIYPDNYVISLIERSIQLKANGIKVGNYGGVVRTVPGDDSLKALVISRVLSSSFGVGASLFRIGAKKVSEVDTVPFGCFPIEVFDEVGYFDNDLIRNQDDELNGRIKNAGYRIFLDPEICVDYYARNNLAKLYTMFFQYGYFKPLVNYKLTKPATKRQFVPPLFVVMLLLSISISWYSSLPILLLLLVYLLFCLLFVRTCTSDISANFLQKTVYSVTILFVAHFSYGWGYLQGIVHWTLNTKTKLT